MVVSRCFLVVFQLEGNFYMADPAIAAVDAPKTGLAKVLMTEFPERLRISCALRFDKRRSVHSLRSRVHRSTRDWPRCAGRHYSFRDSTSLIAAFSRASSATGIPASPSLETATICDSVNLTFFTTSPVPCGRVQLDVVNLYAGMVAGGELPVDDPAGNLIR